MEQMSTPRVVAAYLNHHIGRVVCIVGNVQQLLGEHAIIDADGSITIHLTQDSHLINGNAAQVIGKVNPDLSIKALTAVDVGPGVDMTLCTFIAELNHRHKNFFDADK